MQMRPPKQSALLVQAVPTLHSHTAPAARGSVDVQASELPQLVPQLPQWAASLLRSLHAPVQQVSLAVQLVAQTPQWASSLSRFTQPPAQQVSLAVQLVAQAPQ